jgi:uncharacterized protein YecT (DUF1311 family)
MFKFIVALTSIIFCTATYSEVYDTPLEIQSSIMNQKISNCLDKGDRELQIFCLKNEYSTVDKVLNFNYKLLASILKDVDADQPQRHSLEKLKESQRMWLIYRDLAVKFSQNDSSWIIEEEVPPGYSEPSYNGTKQNAEIEKYVSLINNTHQRANIIYNYISCNGVYSKICPISVG